MTWWRKNGYMDMLAELKSAVDTNDTIVQHILKDVDNVFDNLTHETKGKRKKAEQNVPIFLKIY